MKHFKTIFIHWLQLQMKKYTALHCTLQDSRLLNIRLFTFLQSWRFKRYKYLYKKYNLKNLKQEQCELFLFHCYSFLFLFAMLTIQDVTSSKIQTQPSKVLLFCWSIVASFLSIFPRSGSEHSLPLEWPSGETQTSLYNPKGGACKWQMN